MMGIYELYLCSDNLLIVFSWLDHTSGNEGNVVDKFCKFHISNSSASSELKMVFVKLKLLESRMDVSWLIRSRGTRANHCVK